MSGTASWYWDDAPKAIRKATVTIPWNVWEVLCSEFPEQLRYCGGSAQEFSADGGKTFHHVVLSVRETFLPSLLSYCDVIEKRLGVARKSENNLPF